MALNHTSLTNDIVAAMSRQLPSGETLSSEAKTFAADLAAAIHRYAAGGEVKDVRVDENRLQTGSARVV